MQSLFVAGTMVKCLALQAWFISGGCPLPEVQLSTISVCVSTISVWMGP